MQVKVISALFFTAVSAIGLALSTTLSSLWETIESHSVPAASISHLNVPFVLTLTVVSPPFLGSTLERIVGSRKNLWSWVT